MKVSVNWIKEFTDVDIPVSELVDKIGQQLGAAEETIDLSKIYSGTIVKVVSADPIEGTHLNLCLVDDNGVTENVNRQENGLVQVVCGAPNVKADMLAVWLAPGVTVPSTVDKEPFVLEAKELRGHISNGMLASPHELGLNDDHEGILEIKDDIKPGVSFASNYKLDDFVIDIENKMFTHRPDCFGELGVAREIAGITGKAFISPDWYLNTLDFPVGDNSLPLEVDNRITEVVPRFMAITLSNVDGSVKSPMWLQTLLIRIGVRPISLIVDITNYMMSLTAQPLHAFDYDKVKALSGDDVAKLIVRHPEDQEEIELLDGKTVKPGPEAIMIASSSKLLALAGIKGGKDTEVTDQTRNIIIECANFDMYSIRRASMALGQFSDASTRFTKGQSPLQLDKVLAKTVATFIELAGAKVASPVIDINNTGLDGFIHPPVEVNTSFINNRLGSSLSKEQISELLTNVEFKVDINNDLLTITAPFWRSDIELPEDIVEEVGRLYGYQHLPVELPSKSINPAPINKSFEIKSSIRKILSSAGANELLTYSFVHKNMLVAANQDSSKAYALSNAISPDLQYYRMSIVPSLLDKVHPNIKSGSKEFVLFEMGAVHIVGSPNKSELDVPAEFKHLGLVVAVEPKTAKSNYSGAAYYQAQAYLFRLLSQLNVYYELVNFSETKVTDGFSEAVKSYEAKRSALIIVDSKVIGVIGEPTQTTKRLMKLPEFSSMFELDLDDVLNNMQLKKYFELSHFPKVEQDICFKVEESVSYQEVKDLTYKFIASKKSEDSYFYVSTIDIYKSDKDNDHKQITLRVSLVSYVKTMTDKELGSLLKELGEEAANKIGAVIV